MCQAKITDHYGMKYRCLRKDYVTIAVSISYGNGHMEGKTKSFNRTLCSFHAKRFKYKQRAKEKKGHTVTIVEELINLNKS